MEKRLPSSLINWVLAFGLGLSMGRAARRWLERRREKSGGGLDSVVSFSARTIAAWRALETLEEEGLFSDPFALALAGEAAFQQALQQAQPFEAGGACASASAAPWRRRQRKVSNVASRVWWFDREVLAALTPRHPAGAAQEGARHEPVVESLALEGAGPHNVVVLGSGMDTRPWRLELPAGVRWYEIDRADVLAAKQQALRDLGVQLSRGEGAGPGGAHHPLRAEQWVALEADLCSPGWAARLRAAGFDLSMPTVWVAEGLVMYLTQQEAEGLLREMAGLG